MSNPSYQDTLMKLYSGGGGGQKRESSGGGVALGEGGLVLPLPPREAATPSAGRRPPSTHSGAPPPRAKATFNNDGERSVASETTSGSGASKSKKKRGSSYHFIPMMGRGSRRRGGSDSDSDSDGDNSEDEGCGGYDSLGTDGRMTKRGHQKSSSRREAGSNSSATDAFIRSDTSMSNRPSPTRRRATGTRALHQQYTVSKVGPRRTSNKITRGESPPRHNYQCDDSTNTKVLKEESDNSRNPVLGERSRGRHEVNAKSGPLHPQEAGGSIAANSSEKRGRLVQRGHEEEANGPFTSPFGRRMWRQCPHQRQQQLGSCFLNRHLPSPDFLRLPPNLVRIRRPSSDESEWANTEDLERQVLQRHLDLEDLAGLATVGSNGPPMGDAPREVPVPISLSSSVLTSNCFTRIIERDARAGLGMSLREYDGRVYVQALLRHDGSRLEEDVAAEEKAAAGPAFRAGLLAGDRLLGVNGRPFLREKDGGAMAEGANSEDVLRGVGAAIAVAQSPMALHIQRESDRGPILSLLKTLRNDARDRRAATTQSLSVTPARTSGDTNAQRGINGSPATPQPPAGPKGPFVHPLATALADRSLIQRGREELAVTRQLRSLTERARQWESRQSFCLRAADYALRPTLDARDVEPAYYAAFLADDGRDCPPFFDYAPSRSLRPYAPSTPLLRDPRRTRGAGGAPAARRRLGLSLEEAIIADLYSGYNQDKRGIFSPEPQDLIPSANKDIAYSAYPGREAGTPDINVPLLGIRKAMSVRILNSFLDNKNRVAFTIWCHDVESGMEWYAPVRYYTDFKDLRAALIRVEKSIGDIPFPSLAWGFGFSSGKPESKKSKETRRRQLEAFLRQVIARMYYGQLHPHLTEVAVHLQTFVGCDTIVSEESSLAMSLSKQVAISESTYGKRTPDPGSELDYNARKYLKSSVQRYVYRLFFLPCLERLISQFVNAAMEKVEAMGPSAQQTRQSHQFAVDKGEATKDVEKIRDFIDQVQELILEGCQEDLISISERRDFTALEDDAENSVRDELFRQAVREQTELEVYVPLRSTISKYLVYAWFNEDMEMKHKMKALAEKPQSYFKIPKEHRSRSDWKSVSRILEEGVGRSTLPCVKLRALVDAANEINQLNSEERSVFPDATFFDGKVGKVPTRALGGDDFLPIFIFCFVQSKIERPAALYELLSVMCDPRKMSGETGYYLASFHAALTHIHELDLKQYAEDLSIIFDA